MVDVSQPVKLGVFSLDSLSLMFCDAPYERHLYKNTYYFTKCLHASQVREITSLAIPCTGRVALDKLGPESEPSLQTRFARVSMDLYFSAGLII